MQTAVIGLPESFWERDWIDELTRPERLVYLSSEQVDVRQPFLVLFSESGCGLVGAVKTLLGKAHAAGNRRIGVVHLGDEYCRSPVEWYDSASFVVRNYFRYRVSEKPNVLTIPLGYKSGFKKNLRPRSLSERRYKWFFAGEAKTTRFKMLAAVKSISGGRLVTTSKWDDPTGLSTQDYASCLAESVFALCPRGNNSVDCFRLYEALEAGAIPIVEDDGRYDWLLTAMHVPSVLRTWKATHRVRYRYRERFGYSYWLRMFGQDCPLPRITDWTNLTEVINEVDPHVLGPRIQEWWQIQKQYFGNCFHRLIDRIQ